MNEIEQKEIEEEKCFNYSHAKTLYNADYRNVKDKVVFSREEHIAFISEFNALQHKYNDICDRYRLCKDANETIKQKCAELIKENGQFRLENNDLSAQVTQACKETAEKFAKAVKNRISIFKTELHAQCEEYLGIEPYEVDELAKRYGVEVKE